MGTVVGTGLNVGALKAEFFQRFGEVHKTTLWPEVTTRIESTTNKETYKFLGQVPPLREWGQGRLIRGMAVESYDVENLKYESTLEVDRDEIADDQLGQIRVRVNELADRAATHKDSLLASLLKNGATASFNAYDGKTFFATDHESFKSGAQSNSLTITGTADPNQPTTAEFRAAFRDAVAQMLGLKDDQGEPMSFGATGLICIVPPSMFVTAAESINASIVSQTDNVLRGAAQIRVLPHLSDQKDKWYLVKTDVAVRPFIFQDREAVEFTALEERSDEGFRREKFLYGVRARYRLTYGYWQFAVRVDFDA